ncbi:MAG: hypothetical protein KAW12_09745 [Candidatus Aminicenantes bacterium]|nr:hypothetical protein [Candidatus Aminicenantes bacterium]
MEGLDHNLGRIMQDFWAGYSPKLQEWLFYIKQILSGIPGKIADLEKKMAAGEAPTIKAKYQKLIDMQQERKNRWRNVGAMLITKVLTLEDVTTEINNLQKTKLDSTTSLNKIIREFKEYEKDLKETL